MTSRRRPVPPAALPLLTILSPDRWMTVEEVAAAAAAAGQHVSRDPDGHPTVRDFPVCSALRAFRRHGWVIYDRRKARHKRTPTGGDAARRFEQARNALKTIRELPPPA